MNKILPEHIKVIINPDLLEQMLKEQPRKKRTIGDAINRVVRKDDFHRRVLEHKDLIDKGIIEEKAVGLYRVPNKFFKRKAYNKNPNAFLFYIDDCE